MCVLKLVSALAFAHKVGEGAGVEVASPRSQASEVRGKEEEPILGGGRDWPGRPGSAGGRVWV